MKYTDDQYLLNCLFLLIKANNDVHMHLTGDLSYMFRDGIEEPLDEGLLSKFMYDLIDRCGIDLKNGMFSFRGDTGSQ